MASLTTSANPPSPAGPPSFERSKKPLHSCTSVGHVVQAAVKTAYCTTCPTDVQECNGFFDLSKDGGPAGLGGFALVVSEAIDQQIQSQCSSATSPKCDP